MHNTEGEWTRNDITEVSDEEWRELRGTVNLVAGGTPCQSFSIAGKRLGFEDTRGTLFFYYANAIKQIEPEYFMFENVKGIINHDKGNTIKTILKTFDEIGYAVDFDIFNSKYYGVPQNRERVFIVGKRKTIAHDYPQRDITNSTKTIDKMRLWAKENVELISILPSNTGLEVTCRLRDVLETEVDEKFYLSKEQTDRLVFNMGEREKSEDEIKILAHRKNYRRNTQVFDKDGLTETLDTGQGGGRGHYTMEEPTLEPVGNVNPSGKGMNGQVYNTIGLSPTLSTNKGEGSKILIEGLPIKEATKQGYALATDGDSVNIQYPDSKTRRGRVGNQIANTLQAGETNQGVVDIKAQTFRIRKLTPLETFRLQGFPDNLFYKAQEVNSNSQLYKQAGNSVTVNVIEAIAKELRNI